MVNRNTCALTYLETEIGHCDEIIAEFVLQFFEDVEFDAIIDDSDLAAVYDNRAFAGRSFFEEQELAVNELEVYEFFLVSGHFSKGVFPLLYSEVVLFDPYQSRELTFEIS